MITLSVSEFNAKSCVCVQLQIAKDTATEKTKQNAILQKELEEQRQILDKLRSSHQKGMVSLLSLDSKIVL